MNAKTIEGITQKIFHQFPEVAGGKPSIKAQPSAKTPDHAQTYLLTFKGHAQSNGGPSFPRTVRVVANEFGKILKVTTSR